MSIAVIQPGRLGDILICQGIVNTLCKDNYAFWPVTKEYYEIFKHFKNVFPFKLVGDLNKSYKEAEYTISSFYQELVEPKIYDICFGFIGTEKITSEWEKSGLPFDEYKYKLSEVDFEYKWEKFKWQRYKNKEEEVWNHFNIQESYVFVHDCIHHSPELQLKINTNKRIIRTKNIKKCTVLDYYKVIKNADEIHCIDSSFSNFIDLAKLNIPKYMHYYIRPESRNKQLRATLREDWIKLEAEPVQSLARSI